MSGKKSTEIKKNQKFTISQEKTHEKFFSEEKTHKIFFSEEKTQAHDQESQDQFIILSSSSESSSNEEKNVENLEEKSAENFGFPEEKPRDSTFLGENLTQNGSGSGPGTFGQKFNWTPWVKEAYNSSTEGLAKEIQHFIQWVSPTPEEKKMRQDLLSRVNSVVQELWHHAKMEVIGSCKTDLCLPTSDIDLVILGVSKDPSSQPLFLLASALEDKRISRGKVKVITTAKVPILKFKDFKSGYNVDVAFEISTGLENTKIVESFLTEYPLLRPLTLVIKYFLKQWGMNDTWSGGIGSYTLVIIIISFLQKQTKLKGKMTNETENFADLLLGFFEFYGRKFNYEEHAISIKDCCYYNKKTKKWFNEQNPELLSVEDPFSPEIDVGAASFQIELAKQAFEGAYLVLSNALKPKKNRESETQNPQFQLKSYLSLVLHNSFTYFVLQFRGRIKKSFTDENNFPPFSQRNSGFRKPYNGKYQKNRRCGNKNYYDENKYEQKSLRFDIEDFPSLPPKPSGNFSDNTTENSDGKYSQSKSGQKGHYGLPSKTENPWTFYPTQNKIKWPTSNGVDKQN